MTDPLSKQSFSARVATGVFWSSVISLSIKALGVVSTFLLLRILSVHEYGTYQLALAAWGLLSVFLFSGIDQLVVAHVTTLRAKGSKEVAGEVTKGYIIFHILVSAALGGIGLVGLDVFRPWYSDDILDLVQILSLAFFAAPIARWIRLDFSVRQKYVALSIFTLIEDVLKLALLVVFVFSLGRRIDGVAWSIALAAWVVAILFLPMTHIREMLASGSWNLASFFRLLWDQGKWVVLQKELRLLEKNARPFFIQYFIGREAVALYSLGEKLLTHLMTIVPADDVLVPAIASQAHDVGRLQRVLERGVKYSVPFYAALGVVAVVLARPFLSTFFPNYLPALPLFSIFVLYLPLTGIGYLLTSFYLSHQEQRAQFYLVLARSVLFFFFAPVLLMSFGVMGAAAEFVVTVSLFNLFRYLSLVRHHPELRVRWHSLFLVDSYDRAVIQRIRSRLTEAFLRR